MDNVSMQDKLNTRLNESCVYVLMKEFFDVVSLCPSAQVEIKSPKREKIISKESNKLYHFHSNFGVPLNDYGNSVILIENHLPVKYMVEEVAQFIFFLELFYKEIKKANNIQELNAYYKQFKLKPKQLIDALLKDLELYSNRYIFEINKREIAMSINGLSSSFGKEYFSKQDEIKSI